MKFRKGPLTSPVAQYTDGFHLEHEQQEILGCQKSQKEVEEIYDPHREVQLKHRRFYTSRQSATRWIDGLMVQWRLNNDDAAASSSLFCIL